MKTIHKTIKNTKITKETPSARKARVSSGVRFRSAVFADKKKREMDKKQNFRALPDGKM